MKVVDLKTFLSYPDGVVFAEYEPCFAGDFMVRGRVFPGKKLSNYAYQAFDLFNTEETLFDVGDESKIEHDAYFKTGPVLDETQLFVVLDKDDLSTLIERLQRAYNEAKE